MRFILVTFGSIFFIARLHSQSLVDSTNLSLRLEKPILPITSFTNWPYTSSPAISNDGKYASCIIEDPNGANVLVIQSSINLWKKELEADSKGFFTDDSKQLIFLNRDTLCFLQLGKNEIIKVSHVKSFKCPELGSKMWIGYQQNGDSKRLVLYNTFDKSAIIFDNVLDYFFDDLGKLLILKTSKDSSSSDVNSLKCFSLISKKTYTVWSVGKNDADKVLVNSCVFDSKGNQFAFIVNYKGENNYSSIWYYKIGMSLGIELVNDRNCNDQLSLPISSKDQLSFSKNCNWLFFKVQKPLEGTNGGMVDIWSYTDIFLKSEQSKFKSQTFNAVVSLKNYKVNQLEQANESVVGNLGSFGDFIVIEENAISSREPWWKLRKKSVFYLVDMNTGARQVLSIPEFVNISFSPLNKYIVYFDPEQKSYISYNISTKEYTNISKRIMEKLTDESYDDLPGPPYEVGIAGWLKNETEILVYDNYDIWALDPEGNNLPRNITNSYGRIHCLKFRLAISYIDNMSLTNDDMLLLTAFDKKTKYNGFYKTKLNKKGDPQLLVIGPATYYHEFSQLPKINVAHEFSSGMIPIKAKYSNTWIVERMSYNEFPNYYITGDFKNFSPLSNIHPEKSYNWFTAELISWKQLDGIETQGILYKPEDFNPHKRYPLIIHYYEKYSHRVYEFPKPYYSMNEINIPWFVSQGYLVLTPDIKYSLGNTGESAYNSIISAVRFLSRNDWIDSNRIGIQGFSFGGYQTYYLICHSNIFAAAAVGAGTSNWISAYGSLSSSNGTRHYLYETDQSRIGSTLWERPDLYIKNSPIFDIINVKTPLLIMHNREDKAVPWQQGVEFFLGMRRLGKKCWLLQYDGEGHGLGKEINQIDFTIRLTQFFDYYLKGLQQPSWLVDTIPSY